ncbi:hypothetical protein [Protofrankia symbiont of Coriaria ruscifolia]|nr:hypothetical protein [Protofrankia symbiont of Coriaria ruscifolia]
MAGAAAVVTGSLVIARADGEPAALASTLLAGMWEHLSVNDVD